MSILIIIGALALAGIAATVVTTVRDGYRRQPPRGVLDRDAAIADPTERGRFPGV